MENHEISGLTYCFVYLSHLSFTTRITCIQRNASSILYASRQMFDIDNMVNIAIRGEFHEQFKTIDRVMKHTRIA